MAVTERSWHTKSLLGYTVTVIDVTLNYGVVIGSDFARYVDVFSYGLQINEGRLYFALILKIQLSQSSNILPMLKHYFISLNLTSK